MKNPKIVIVIITVLISVWVGSLTYLQFWGNIQPSHKVNSVKAKSLEGQFSFLPIIFGGAGGGIKPTPTVQPTPEITPIPDIDTLFGVEMYNMTPDGGLNRMDEAGITWIRHNDTNPGPETNALIWTAVEHGQEVDLL